MIQYDFGKWGIKFIFTLSGSVFPVAIVFACPCAISSVVMWYVFHYLEHNPNYSKPNIEEAKFLFSNYCFVLGFLLVFRTQIAYSRFWEGGSILQDMRSSWLNVTSSLVAFASSDPGQRLAVERFFHLLIRLMSLMHCSALQEVADMADENFDIISCDGIDEPSMFYLVSLDSAERVEVIMQWIQRLIVNSQANGVISSAPPIVSRCFQELGNGRLSFNAAKKIAAFPFPFPYAQMLMVMLIIHWIVAPVMAALLLEDPMICAAATFVTSLAFWCINYIAAELEMPFGDNTNDLPVEELQVNFNGSLRRLMNPGVHAQPSFDFKEGHNRLDYIKMRSMEEKFLTRTASPCVRGDSKDWDRRDPHSALARRKSTRKPTGKHARALAGALASRGVDLFTHSAPVAGVGRGCELFTGSVSSRTPSSVGADEANEAKLQPKASGKDVESQGPSSSEGFDQGTERPHYPEVFQEPDHRPSITEAGGDTDVTPATKLSAVMLDPFPEVPLSPEEVHSLGLTNLRAGVEERLSKIVQELVHLLVPGPGTVNVAADRAGFDVGYQANIMAAKQWRPASDMGRLNHPPNSSPDPEFFLGVVSNQAAL